jgi:prophage antirepressor-like protein
MSQSLALTFNGVTLSPISHKNQIWLTSIELAKSLGYADEKSVSRIFTRNKDEFSGNMTTLFQGGQIDHLGESKGVQNGTRIFSLRGCHLISMFAKTAIAKQFRVWVLDVLDKEVSEPKPYALRELPVSPFVTPKEKLLLRTAIENQCAKTKEAHAYYWRRLHNAYHVSRLEDLPTGKVDEMLAFLSLREPTLDEYVVVKQERLLELEQKVNALPTSKPAFQIPNDMVMISSERYCQMERSSLKLQLDDLKFVVEQSGGLVLMKSEVDKMKGVLKA